MQPLRHLGRCLTEGFAYQGEPSPYRDGERARRAERAPAAGRLRRLPAEPRPGRQPRLRRAPLPACAAARRCDAVTARPAARAATAACCSWARNSPPRSPSSFFCDFGTGAELANAVTEGRRREFARFARFRRPAVRGRIPDPNAVATFRAACSTGRALTQAPHRATLALYRAAARPAPRMDRAAPGRHGQRRAAVAASIRDTGARRQLAPGRRQRLQLAANLGDSHGRGVRAAPRGGDPLFASPAARCDALASGRLPPWSVHWRLTPAKRDAIDLTATRRRPHRRANALHSLPSAAASPPTTTTSGARQHPASDDTRARAAGGDGLPGRRRPRAAAARRRGTRLAAAAAAGPRHPSRRRRRSFPSACRRRSPGGGTSGCCHPKAAARARPAAAASSRAELTPLGEQRFGRRAF